MGSEDGGALALAEDEAEGTVVASPAARRKADGEAPPEAPTAPILRGEKTRRGTVAGTTLRVLQTEEAGRILSFSRIGLALCTMGLVALPFVYSKRTLYWPMAATILALFLVSAATLLGAKKRGYSRRVNRLFMATFAAGGMFIVFDLGAFSPAPLFIVLGIAWFAYSGDRPFAIGVSVACSLGYFVLALLLHFGVVPDLGLFAAAYTPPAGRALMAFVVPITYLVAAWQARQSRTAMVAAIEQSHEALRLALLREAQLEEAEESLDRARRAEAKGLYSGALVGPYRLEALVGRGGMGEVYAATHVDEERPAAVKLLQASVGRDPDLVERFYREGRIAARLLSPYIVEVFDVGGADAGLPYIAMELLSGQDLSAMLRKKHRLELFEVEALASDVARGLPAAHAAGVVHRDLKPHNLFCAESGEGRPPTWKILDFGVSKLVDTGATLTNAAIIGTPGYMSPEQAEGKDADHRSDIFSLGAVMYRALTGRPPFAGDAARVLFEIAYKSPVRPAEIVPGLPGDVERVLAISLAKDPVERFESALELEAAMRDACREALDPELRSKADRLLAAQPWASAIGATGK